MRCWKSIDLMLPDSLSPADVLAQVRAQIRIVASEAGEFVEQIRIGTGVAHPEGYMKWTASYLIGPPGVFPA